MHRIYLNMTLQSYFSEGGVSAPNSTLTGEYKNSKSYILANLCWQIVLIFIAQSLYLQWCFFFKNRPVILWPSKICLYSVTFLRLNRCHLMYSMSTLHSGVSDSSSAFLDHNSTKQTLLYPSNHPEWYSGLVDSCINLSTGHCCCEIVGCRERSPS